MKDYFVTIASHYISQQHGDEITDIMWEYYRLATERKPEFMVFNESQWAGWPPVQVRCTAYGITVMKWNSGCATIRNFRAGQKKIAEELPEEASDAYFQLVYYPIAGATAMNEKWLYAYKSREYAK